MAFALTNLYPLTFTNVTEPTVAYGTSTVTVSGTLADGSEIPVGEPVTITLDGMKEQPDIDSNGDFSAVFNTGSITAADSPYPIELSYASDGKFAAAATASVLTVNVATPAITLRDGEPCPAEPLSPRPRQSPGSIGIATSSLEGVPVSVSYYGGTFTSPSQLTGLTRFIRRRAGRLIHSAGKFRRECNDYARATPNWPISPSPRPHRPSPWLTRAGTYKKRHSRPPTPSRG